MLNDVEKVRIYVRTHDMHFFEKLLTKNKIPFIHDTDYLTNVKSGRFYVKKIDTKAIDTICIKHNILLSNDFVSTNSYSTIDKQHYILKKIPKSIIPIFRILIVIYVLYTIFGNLL